MNRKATRLTHTRHKPSQTLIMFEETLVCSQCNFDGMRVYGTLESQPLNLVIILAYIRHPLGVMNVSAGSLTITTGGKVRGCGVAGWDC